MRTLGDDLILLSVWQGGGVVISPEITGVALMGAELVLLAGGGRIDIAKGRISVVDAAPTGDAEADATLAGLAAQQSPPWALAWCSRPRRGICDAYLARLAAAGIIYPEQRTRFGFFRVTRWQIIDQGRAIDARTRLDAIAQGTAQVDLAEAAYGGLAHATGLAARLYPGRANRALRRRLERVAAGRLTARTAGPGDQTAPVAVASAVRVAVSAAKDARVAGYGGRYLWPG
jgi:Golgi phosphoprotein 3 (GPP34)